MCGDVAPLPTAVGRTAVPRADRARSTARMPCGRSRHALQPRAERLRGHAHILAELVATSANRALSAARSAAAARLAGNAERIARLFASDRLEDILAALAADPSEWAAKELKAVASKCPTTSKVALRQFADRAAGRFRRGNGARIPPRRADDHAARLRRRACARCWSTRTTRRAGIRPRPRASPTKCSTRSSPRCRRARNGRPTPLDGGQEFLPGAWVAIDRAKGQFAADATADASRPARGGEHPHHARGGRRGRAAR